MSKETNQSKDYLIHKINSSDNEEYKSTMLNLLNVIWTQTLYQILDENHFELESKDSEIKAQIVTTTIDHMSKDNWIDYVQKLCRDNTINSRNIAQFIRNNDKYFDIITFVLCHRDSERESNLKEVDTFLCEALKDEVLEVRLVEKAKLIQKTEYNSDNGNGLSGYTINAYISNNEIDKALKLHEDIWAIYIEKLHPVRFFERMMKAGHIDQITHYFLKNEKIKKEFNWDESRTFHNLQKIFKIFMTINKKKAIDFFTHPEIIKMQCWSDAGDIIDIMTWVEDSEDAFNTISSNRIKSLEKVDEKLFFEYITSEGIINLRYDGDRVVRNFRYIGKKYWADFMKKILVHNNCAWAQKLIDWSKNYNKSCKRLDYNTEDDWETMLKKVNQISRY